MKSNIEIFIQVLLWIVIMLVAMEGMPLIALGLFVLSALRIALVFIEGF
tara:strand:- start:49 stop:195 length:147 start_codon:yes stop_codon:yes gene_type:complete